KTSGGQSSKSLEQQLSDMQNQLQMNQTNYTDKHPKVIQLKHAIAQLEKQIESAPAKDLTATEEQKAAIPVIETPQVQQLRAQLHQQELSIIQKAKQQEELQKQIRVLQARIESSPGDQQESQALTRDYQRPLTSSHDLLKRRNARKPGTA